MNETASNSLLPGTIGSPRLRLPSLTNSSSSLSSTFSDVSFSSSFSVSSPFPSSGSKTQAFFASPFSTRSHSPDPLHRQKIPTITAPSSNPDTGSKFPDLPAQRDNTHNFFPSFDKDSLPKLQTPHDDLNGAAIQSKPIVDDPTPRPASLVPALLFTKVDISSHEPSSAAFARTPPFPQRDISPERSFHVPPPPPLSTSASTSSTTSDSSASASSQTLITGQNTDTALRLLHPLGEGSFSLVWLAEDLSPVPLMLKAKRRLRDLRGHRDHSLESPFDAIGARLRGSGDGHLTSAVTDGVMRNTSLKRLRARVRGTKPSRGNIRLQDGTYLVDERDGEMGVIIPDVLDLSETEDFIYAGTKELGLSTGLARVGSLSGKVTNVASNEQHLQRRNVRETTGRLVAVKLTPRGTNDQREAEKERVAFVREVEVLRHISHANIAPLLSHLSTPTHYVLVFPYLPGGDLLSLVNSDTMWCKLGEDVLRRIWCEICRAVGWMHGVGLVHRDIKLENILLTTCAFSTLMPESPRPTLEDLPAPPAPLIRLSDFGLSRFVELFPNSEAELLVTRCGSEAYAAPELVTAGGRPRLTNTNVEGGDKNRAKSVGVYDARETDAWACGVVLYTLVVQKLPFGEGIAGIKSAGERPDKTERKRWLMRIAKGEYSWPEVGNTESPLADLVGPSLASSCGVKRIVGKLLVRDPGKRARIADLWADPWMGGTGIDRDLSVAIKPANTEHDFIDELGNMKLQQGGDAKEDSTKVDEKILWQEEEELQELEQQEEQHGPWIVDQHAIHSIARQELA